MLNSGCFSLSMALKFPPDQLSFPSRVDRKIIAIDYRNFRKGVL